MYFLSYVEFEKEGLEQGKLRRIVRTRGRQKKEREEMGMIKVHYIRV